MRPQELVQGISGALAEIGEPAEIRYNETRQYAGVRVMLFAVDIDGTIAESEKGQSSLIRYMNRELGIGLSEERLRTFRSCHRRISAEIQQEMETSEQEREKWHAYFSRFTFEGSPEVQHWLVQSLERQARYTRVEQASQDDGELQAAKVPIVGAVEAMHQLARVGRLIYVSLRKPATLANEPFPSSKRFLLLIVGLTRLRPQATWGAREAR